MSKNKDIQPMDLNDLNNDLNGNGMDTTLGNQVTSFSADLDQPSKQIEDTLEDMQDIESTMDVTTSAVPKLFDDQTVLPSDEITATDEANTTPTGAFEPGEIELAPAVVSEKQTKAKRRIRKLIIDDVKEIDSVSMKTQLSDTSNILGQLELAPPTRRLMQLKETSGVDKMFSLTSRPLHSKALLKVILLEKIEPNHVSTI